MKRSWLKRGTKQLKRGTKKLQRVSKRKEYLISSASKLKNTQAWKNLSLFVRTEEGGVCFCCNAVNPIEKCDAGHFIQAHGNSAVFFERRGIHCQCTRCNRYLSGNLLIYNDKMIEKYGPEAVKELRQKAREYFPGYSKEQLKEIAKEYNHLK
jgi:hypothetical protein